MSTFPWEILILAAVLAGNRLVVPGSYNRPAVFWGFQALNIAIAIATAFYGLPGLSTYPIVSWMVAGLLAFHVFQNFALRDAALIRARRDKQEREQLRKLREIDREE